MKGTGSYTCWKRQLFSSRLSLVLSFVQEQRGTAYLNLRLWPKVTGFAYVFFCCCYSLIYLVSEIFMQYTDLQHLAIPSPSPPLFVSVYTWSCGLLCLGIFKYLRVLWVCRMWPWTNSVQKYLNCYLKCNLYKNLNKHQSED